MGNYLSECVNPLICRERVSKSFGDVCLVFFAYGRMLRREIKGALFVLISFLNDYDRSHFQVDLLFGVVFNNNNKSSQGNLVLSTPSWQMKGVHLLLWAPSMAKRERGESGCWIPPGKCKKKKKGIVRWRIWLTLSRETIIQASRVKMLNAFVMTSLLCILEMCQKLPKHRARD